MNQECQKTGQSIRAHTCVILVPKIKHSHKRWIQEDFTRNFQCVCMLQITHGWLLHILNSTSIPTWDNLHKNYSRLCNH